MLNFVVFFLNKHTLATQLNSLKHFPSAPKTLAQYCVCAAYCILLSLFCYHSLLLFIVIYPSCLHAFNHFIAILIYIQLTIKLLRP